MVDLFPGATLVQLLEWGYPMGAPRRTPPPTLGFSVIHITANTARAEAEAAWRLNDPALQNSATFFVNQDGSIVQTLGDPLLMAPWTNGDVQNPDLQNPRIAALGGVNPNIRSLVTIENIGREPAMPISEAQIAVNAKIIRHYHAKAGIAVSRETVIGHYQINSVNRINCPSTDKSIIDRIVALAKGSDEMDAGFKQAGTPIGTFRLVGDHQLISPLDLTVRFPRPDGSVFAVIAAVDLKDSNGNPIDVTGSQPPRNNWDQVYLVDAPAFGIAAYVLRQDGIFTPTGADAATIQAAWEAWILTHPRG